MNATKLRVINQNNTPRLDRPICPSLGALWPNLLWGESWLKRTLLNSPWRSSTSHIDPRELRSCCPEGGSNSGMSAVSNIPAAGVSVSATPLLINASSAPTRSFSPFSLPPQQYSIQKCWITMKSANISGVCCLYATSLQSKCLQSNETYNAFKQHPSMTVVVSCSLSSFSQRM